MYNFRTDLADERREVYENIPVNLLLNSESLEIKVPYIIKTIIKNGDTVGLLILIGENNLENNDIKLFELMTSFLDKYLE